MIIGISGKIGSGKDTVAKMIHFLSGNGGDIDEFKQVTPSLIEEVSEWETKRFADKLKDIVCLLIGCTREQLEDREFKEKPLGEQWDKYYVYYTRTDKPDGVFATREEAVEHSYKIGASKKEVKATEHLIQRVRLTPRKLMQLLGTEAGREILHPNIWVSATFADYGVMKRNFHSGDYMGKCKDCGESMDNVDKRQPWCRECCKKDIYPNWIIPDARFPNEAEAIKERDGIMIRVYRKNKNRFPQIFAEYQSVGKTGETFLEYIQDTYPKLYEKLTHPSEISLDSWQDWDYVIDNNGSLKDLLTEVRRIYEQHAV